MKYNFKRIDCKTRAEWLEQRANGIGATDIAAIAGLSPWRDSYSLWLSKKNPSQEEDEETPAIVAGRLLEDAVAKWYERESGNVIIKSSAGDWLAQSPENELLRCSPDRFYRRLGGGVGILECKTCRKAFDPEQLPPHYVAQVQWQMLVTGLRHATIAWLASGIDFGYAEVSYDEAYAQSLKRAAIEWWRRFMDGSEIPEPQTADTVKLRYPQPVAAATIADDDELAAWRSLKEVNAKIKELEGEKKRLSDVICSAIGGNDSLVIADENGGAATLATYKSQNSTRLDSARLQKEQPDIFVKYSTMRSTRVLRIKE